MADLNKSYDTNVDTLAKFGPSFQSKVAAVMMQSPEFLEQSFDIINPNFFELDANKWIVKNTLTYFSEYKTLPTLEVFKVELNQQIKDDTFRTAIVEQLRGIFQRIKDTDLDYVRDSFIEFAKNQTLKSAIIKSVDLLQNGQYGDIKTLIDGAMRSGQPKTVGHDWKKDVELRLTKSARNTVATGWDIVDAHIGGGLAGSEAAWQIASRGVRVVIHEMRSVRPTAVHKTDGLAELSEDTTTVEPGSTVAVFGAGGAGASSSPGPVNVVFRVFRGVNVNHQRNPLNVNSSCRNVGGNQHSGDTIFELLQRLGAHCL